MTLLRVRNWDKWQSYRRDRRPPPWIKIHRCLMSNPEWAVLSDAEKGQLVSLWILAADKNGELPYDEKILRKLCMLDDDPDIKKFIELGFLDAVEDAENNHSCQTGVRLASDWRQGDAPEAEAEAEAEYTPPNGGESAKPALSDQPAPEPDRESGSKQRSGSPPPCPHLQIVEAYNSILGDVMPTVRPKLWSGTRRKHLAARWREDTERQSLDWWDRFFREVREIPFLTGGNDRGWTADLGWLIKPGNMVKILEGKYRQTNRGKRVMNPRNMKEAQTLVNDRYAKILLAERRREKNGNGDAETGTDGNALLEPPFP